MFQPLCDFVAKENDMSVLLTNSNMWSEKIWKQNFVNALRIFRMKRSSVF